MNFGAVSSSYEIRCPHSWSSRHTTVSKHYASFGCFDEKDRHRFRNCDAGKVMVSQPLMSGHIQESYTGRKNLEEVVSGSKVVRTLLIDNYDSYTYNIFQELATINGGKLHILLFIFVQPFAGIYRERISVILESLIKLLICLCMTDSCIIFKLLMCRGLPQKRLGHPKNSSSWMILPIVDHSYGLHLVFYL